MRRVVAILMLALLVGTEAARADPTVDNYDAGGIQVREHADGSADRKSVV